MVFSTSDRSGAAYGVVQDADRTQCGSQANTHRAGLVALDDGLWRGSRLHLNEFARADRVAVRVRFPLGDSRIAGPTIAHVDMLAGCM